MGNKKYVLTEETITIDGVVLHRIKSISNFSNVKIGDLGGFIESEKNLSVSDSAWVSGSAQVSGSADYIIFKNWWSSGRFFTWTKSNNMWKVGCFYGSGEKLIKKAYQDSELSGREYERVVQYVNSILADEKIAFRMLAAKRLYKSEQEYICFVAEHPELYNISQCLEERLTETEKMWVVSEKKKQIEDLKQCKELGEAQLYYEEIERMTNRLKENFRKCLQE